MHRFPYLKLEMYIPHLKGKSHTDTQTHTHALKVLLIIYDLQVTILNTVTKKTHCIASHVELPV